MDYKEIIKKIKSYRCVVYKLNYEVNIEKMKKYPDRPMTVSISHWTALDITIADYSVRLDSKLKIDDTQFGRYIMVLDFFIYITFKEPTSQIIEKKLIKEKDADLLYEFLKLSISQMDETIRKSFEWMDFGKAERIPELLMKTYKEMSKKRGKVEVEH